jgi:hypothetical protein
MERKLIIAEIKAGDRDVGVVARSLCEIAKQKERKLDLSAEALSKMLTDGSRVLTLWDTLPLEDGCFDFIRVRAAVVLVPVPDTDITRAAVCYGAIDQDLKEVDLVPFLLRVRPIVCELMGVKHDEVGIPVGPVLFFPDAGSDLRELLVITRDFTFEDT